jgi:hypothetical protein
MGHHKLDQSWQHDIMLNIQNAKIIYNLAIYVIARKV